jgi:hypothetical protein
MDLWRLFRSWERRRSSTLLVHYEDLVTAPTETVTKVFNHLGLEHRPAVIAQVLETARAFSPELEGHRTTKDPAASIGRWRSDLAAIHPELPDRCEELFGPLLTEFGYSVRPVRSRHMADQITGVLDKLESAARTPEAAQVPPSEDVP